MNNSSRLRAVASRRRVLIRVLAVLAMAALTSAADTARAEAEGSLLSGRWRAAETADEKRQRLEAIEQATASLNGLRRERARGRLSQRTAPRNDVTLEIEGSKVILASEDRQLELQLGGPATQVSGDDGKAQTSATMDGPALIVVARSGKGERRTAYLANGDHLSVEVTMTNARLARPVNYVTTYVRAD